jgi:hypothetical protein
MGELSMKRVQQEAMREIMQRANTVDGGVKMDIPKYAGVKHTVKEQTQMSFATEEELQAYLDDNPQYEINQRFGFGTKSINVEFYERGYGVMGKGFNGVFSVQRWLTPEEIEEYLQDPKA